VAGDGVSVEVDVHEKREDGGEQGEPDDAAGRVAVRLTDNDRTVETRLRFPAPRHNLLLRAQTRY
jgi:hypothetical protein